jgi:inosine-uridine nucleoside N-ribohydrolase
MTKKKMKNKTEIISFLIVCMFCVTSLCISPSEEKIEVAPKKKIILDTDIGHCMDDPFALVLAINSPELEIVGITIENSFYEGEKVALKLLHLAGRDEIPVAANGPMTPGIKKGLILPGLKPGAKNRPPNGCYASWAIDYDETKVCKQNAVDFIISKVKESPGEIILLTIGPLTNIEMAFEKAPEIKSMVKEIIILAGSLYRGYLKFEPEPEWNIECDPKAAKEVFSSGIPITLVGLEVTSDIKLWKENRDKIRDTNKPLTNALWELYMLWRGAWKKDTITIFDPVAVAITVDKTFCHKERMGIEVDNEGYTRVKNDMLPNAAACVYLDKERFIDFFMHRILSQ